MVILDTNIFVAAGFKPKSHSAQIVEQVRDGLLQMVWHEETRQETEFIVRKIPPLSWAIFANLFHCENRYCGELSSENFQQISDRADIKFAALAAATGAILITMDQDFLSVRDRLTIKILTPFEFIAHTPTLFQVDSRRTAGNSGAEDSVARSMSSNELPHKK